MSRFLEIALKPTILTRPVLEETLKNPATAAIHESSLRAYSILDVTKELIRKNTDHDLMLELIALMESPEGTGEAQVQK